MYLSDLEESEFVGNDGLHSIDLYKDRGYGDKLIHIADRDYKKGLVTTPVVVPEGVLSRATYVLDGPLAAARRFKAQVGVDASDSSGKGSCVFLVEVRQSGQWKRLFESGIVKSKEPPRNVELDISGADRLKLVVTDGGDGMRRPCRMGGRHAPMTNSLSRSAERTFQTVNAFQRNTVNSTLTLLTTLLLVPMTSICLAHNPRRPPPHQARCP